MQVISKHRLVIAFVFGVLICVAIGLWYTSGLHLSHFHLTGDRHPIGYADTDTEVHVHSDWLVVINDEMIDFSEDKYQTTALQTIHESIHLHDNNGRVVHRHAHAITVESFINSLGWELTDNCLTSSSGETYCSNEENELAVYVNSIQITDALNYVNQEKDQILIYYGARNNPEAVARWQAEITDLACIYSGTCPERGTPPPEACGITCEL